MGSGIATPPPPPEGEKEEKLDESLNYHELSLKIKVKIHGCNHHGVAKFHNNIGMVYGRAADRLKATEKLERGVVVAAAVGSRRELAKRRIGATCRTAAAAVAYAQHSRHPQAPLLPKRG